MGLRPRSKRRVSLLLNAFMRRRPNKILNFAGHTNSWSLLDISAPSCLLHNTSFNGKVYCWSLDPVSLRSCFKCVWTLFFKWGLIIRTLYSLYNWIQSPYSGYKPRHFLHLYVDGQRVKWLSKAMCI